MFKVLLSLILLAGANAHAVGVTEDMVNMRFCSSTSVSGTSVTYMGKQDGIYSLEVSSPFTLGGTLTGFDSNDAGGDVASNTVVGPIGPGVTGTFYVLRKLNKGLRFTSVSASGAWCANLYNVRGSSEVDHDPVITAP